MIAGARQSFAASFAYPQTHFLSLITSMPELVERYEAVDANGASVRRYMINDPQSHMEMASNQRDHSAQAEQTPEETKDALAASDRPERSGFGGPEHAREGQKDHGSEKDGSAWRDIAYMERRYRSRFTSTSSSSSHGTPATLDSIRSL